MTVRTPESCFGIADWVGMVEACNPTCDAEGPADSVEFAPSLTLFTDVRGPYLKHIDVMRAVK